MYKYTFAKFYIMTVRNSQNYKVFIIKCMLTIKTVLPNIAMTGVAKSQTSANRHSLVFSNASGEVTNRFTNVCRITLSTFILINNIAEQQGRNLVFVLEETAH